MGRWALLVPVLLAAVAFAQLVSSEDSLWQLEDDFDIEAALANHGELSVIRSNS